MTPEKEKHSLRQLTSHDSHRDSGSLTEVGSGTGMEARKRENQLLANPLMNKSESELCRGVDEFVERTGMTDIRELLYRAALVAQDRHNFERLHQLSEEEKVFLREEKTHKWRQTKTLYWQIFMCSMGAVVQGMDETVSIGAKTRHDTILVGLVNAAPYLCSAVFSCWLTYPLSKYLGRRGAIFWSTLCAGLGCIWGAVTNTWWHLFISRLFLGLGIGPKSATVPILAAEISPAAIRGSLEMQWQTWTAFGIMLGTVSSLIFQNVPDKPGITGLNWRLMLGSACLPAIIVCSQVYLTPESPRWLIGKGRYKQAFESLQKLRRSDIQAAVDFYYTAKCIEMEEEIRSHHKRSRFVELFTVPRNRRAARAAAVVMFMQQFCRRSLLLFTLPFLSLFMFIAGSGFYLQGDKNQLAMVVTGVYIFAAFYGPGAGPVPFSYSAEVFPLQVREIGMGLATAITWFFNFVNALVFPLQIQSWGSGPAFYWFGCWNIILWFLVLMFCPETKQFTLEELDEVFSMSTSRQVAYGLASPAYWFRRYVLRQKVHRVPLHEYHPSEEKDRPMVEHREKV
ncbi:Sugar transporter-domain containing protein [Rhodotorula toruloides]|nr:Sugar transporter-domain containing protein [Rhodotorula toruloides]